MTLEQHRRVTPIRRKSAASRNLAVLEALESRTLLSSAPVGAAVVTRTTVSGFAFDPDTPATSITVQVNVDGAPNNLTASTSVPALIPLIGSGNHGFSFTLPTLNPGPHTIRVFAADTSTGKLKLVKTAIVTNPAPQGKVETINATTVSGYAYDTDAGANPINIRIDNNGVAGTPQAASDPRPDIVAIAGSPNHGFSVTGTFGIVDVYAIDSPTGVAKLIGSNSVRPTSKVEIFTANHIKGYAFTPDLGTTAMQIEVDVDGASFQTVTANVSRPDIAAQAGDPNHGFDFTLNALAPGAHHVQIFALDPLSTSNAKVLLASKVLINNKPKGVITAATSSAVTGYVYDPDTTSPIGFDVHVDGASVGTGTANAFRAGIVPIAGSAFHGFSMSLGSLSAGPHKIEIFATDVRSGTSVLVATRWIGNHKPIGVFSSATSFLATGWAYDSDAPTTPVNIVFVMDGVRYAPAAANVNRPDLARILGANTQHGFSLQPPTHLAGTHTIRAYAVDTTTGELTLLGVKTFVNHAPRGLVTFVSKTAVMGWAQDPDAPASAIHVLLRIDGNGSNILQANASGTIAGLPAHHAFAFGFAALSHGRHLLEVFGVDAATGVSTLLGTRAIVVP